MRFLRPFASAAVLAALELTTSRSAFAQTVPSIDVRTWRPSTDPGASLVLEPIMTPGPWVWNVGAYVSFAYRPVTLRNAGTSDIAFRPVDAVLGTDIVAGIGIGTRASLGMSVPTFLYQNGSGSLPPGVASVPSVPRSGIGDLGVQGKATIVENEGGGLGLSALGNVTFPTGERTSFMGEGAVTASARLLAEFSLVLATAQASVGYTLRTEHHIWPAASLGGYTFGDQIPWTLGFSIKPGILKIDKDARQKWEIAFHGSLPAGPVLPFGAGDPGSAALTPMMLALSDRIEIGRDRDLYGLAGVDIGLTSAVGVPTIRGVIGLGWAPREHDMDHDNVADDVDQCPEIPEDRDGFEDSDGCPEIDNDDDGILDKEDACKNTAGVESPDPKKNGCPPGDMDGDGIPDDVDACKSEQGVRTDDPKTNGCVSRDRDGDGINDNIDKCPDQAEDKDGFEDSDGCPDPDDDGDGIDDKLDACPKVTGEPSTDETRNGCPNPDRDGDTYENDADRCPNSAEVFNGVTDEDGCPDEGGKPLVVIDIKDGRISAKLATPLKFAGTAEAPEIDKSSLITLRALALELNRHRDWTLATGARPLGATPAAQQSALSRSFAVVQTLALFSHRDGVAETVSWEAVKKQPFSETGIGFLVLVAPVPTAPKLLPPAGTKK